MNEEATLNSKSCPKCGKAVAVDARFCTFCGLSFINSEQPVRAAFEAPVVDAAGGKSNSKTVILVCVAAGVIALLLLLRDKSESRGSGFVSGSSYGAAAGGGGGADSDRGRLTNAKVEAAARKLLGNVLVGGSVSVEGIQEQPQQNAATADIRFNGFQYKADAAGAPLPKDRQSPPKPEINDPDFYDKMYKYGTQQVQTKTYSGRGTGTLKRYNDGRWVLTEVRWEFNGWRGTVDVQ